MRCDVAFDDHVEHLRHEVLEELGRVDIVMNNAGVAVMGPPETISMEDWDWILQVNLFGVIRGVRAFLPHMMERGSGHIVNTVVARRAVRVQLGHDSRTSPASSVSWASPKASRSTRKPHGVGVSLVCPGLVDDEPRRVGTARRRRRSARMDERDPARRARSSPETVATLVCDAVAEDRFLVLTDPEAVNERVQARAADHDAYIDDMIERLADPAQPAPGLSSQVRRSSDGRRTAAGCA